MDRLVLPQVTLCAVDTRAPALATHSLLRSMAQVRFARSVLFTHAWTPPRAVPGLEVVDIGPVRSGAEYSRFVLRRLADHVRTSFVLVTQWDGFVVDARAWNDDFLQYDYIGAPWPDQQTATAVGNGGFSLRSRRMLLAGQDVRIVQEHPEDLMLCREYRPLLQDEHAIRFAPLALARHFAFENQAPRGPTFGFHGPYHLPRFVDEITLAPWLATLPDAFYRSRDARRLVRALLRHGMPATAQQVVRRRMAAGRREPSTRVLGWAAAMLQRLS
ncbi:MAG: hypothetical protein H7Z19_22785 [Chitinophagaceae bacterium]|nr:hypothetical protein [Rubrivivax sp.]